jgi:hypothetical protein
MRSTPSKCVRSAMLIKPALQLIDDPGEFAALLD